MEGVMKSADKLTIDEMMRLRWGWQGPVQVRETGGDTYFEIRIAELPEFFVAGATREEVLSGAGPALRSFLQTYLDAGDPLPLPADRQVSWMVRLPVTTLPRSLPQPPLLQGAIIQ